jgi:hypothetical protein
VGGGCRELTRGGIAVGYGGDNSDTHTGGAARDSWGGGGRGLWSFIAQQEHPQDIQLLTGVFCRNATADMSILHKPNC